MTVDELMRPVLQRWLSLIMDVPGAPMLAAFAPTPPPSSTPRHRIRADAALEGTPSPGLGGWLYGHWFAVAIADHPGLERLDIPHLEFIAAGWRSSPSPTCSPERASCASKRTRSPRR